MRRGGSMRRSPCCRPWASPHPIRRGSRVGAPSRTKDPCAGAAGLACARAPLALGRSSTSRRPRARATIPVRPGQGRRFGGRPRSRQRGRRTLCLPAQGRRRRGRRALASPGRRRRRRPLGGVRNPGRTAPGDGGAVDQARAQRDARRDPASPCSWTPARCAAAGRRSAGGCGVRWSRRPAMPPCSAACRRTICRAHGVPHPAAAERCDGVALWPRRRQALA